MPVFKILNGVNITYMYFTATFLVLYYPTLTDRNEQTMTWIAFAMMGRCFAAVALSASIQMTFEIFPTVVRVRGVAVASAAGMTASFLSPFIIHSVSKVICTEIH